MAQLQLRFFTAMTAVLQVDGEATPFTRGQVARRARMQWGTARNLASNLVKGVSDGFTINLEINGVGYRAQADAKKPKAAARFQP